MDGHSMHKLMQAGYTFYRVRWSDMMPIGEIWKASEHGKWRKHESGFKSKTATEKRLKQIIQEDPKALTE
ncbi:MAG: hypothetical protein EPGJADBJ_04453 [Saprospiraceae bacterium]|nr:hypothetical protein [Saprospiraceae bacterium]